MTQVQLPSHYVHAYRVLVQCLVIASEREEAGEQHVEEDAKAPHVGHQRVALAFQEDLGRAEEQRTVTLRASLISQKELREAKVHNNRLVDSAAYHDFCLHYYVF